METFEVGQSFFEPPGAIHAVPANASNTEMAELIAVFVTDEGAELNNLHRPVGSHTRFGVLPARAGGKLTTSAFLTLRPF